MKKLSNVMWAASCVLLLNQALMAQPRHAISARYNLYNYVTPQLENTSFGDIWGDVDGGGFEIAYQWCFAPNTFLVAPLKYGTARIPSNSVDAGFDHSLLSLDALLQYEIFPHDNLINPYFHFGIGTTYDADADNEAQTANREENREWDFNIPLGIGVNVRILRNLDFTVQTQFRPSTRGLEGWHHGIGLTYYWGNEMSEDGELSSIKDRDGDGVLDKMDRCPNVPGPASLSGCPDMDGDGVADDEDRCPETKGTVLAKGCPEIAQIDKEVLARAVRNVQFETAQATLLAASYPVLDEVASLMQRYPDYSLRISGHTDDVGDDKMNLDLSKRRAKTCYDYLAGKGVSGDRMNSDGYGETRPIATNSTPEGREQNRRVEFELYVK